MNKILKVEFHNLISDNQTVTVSLAPGVNILTGHNGVGKSSILSAIHDALTLMSDGRFPFPRSDWAQCIYLDSNVKIGHIKLRYRERDSYVSPTMDTVSWDAGYIYKAYRDANHASSHSSDVVITDDEGGRSLKYFNQFIVADPDLPIGAEVELQIGSLLFKDELFYLNKILDVSDQLKELDFFSRSSNLDQTLYLLLSDFSAAPRGLVDLKTEEMVANLIAALEKIDIPEEIRGQYQQLQKLKSSSRYEQVKQVIDTFLDETNREICIDGSGLLAIKLKGSEKVIRWFDFSKGEKTLISLLLMAHLNGASGSVFLLDEPDLSLHIGWQKLLLPALKRLAPDAQFIVSTHSPAMVGNTEGERVINVGRLLRG